jgi:anti-sigma-K factor RskA
MTTASSISRRNFFRSIVAPALAVAVVATAAGSTLSATADAGTPSFNKDYKAGMSKGRKHG